MGETDNKLSQEQPESKEENANGDDAPPIISATAIGGRTAFRDLKRQLTEEDLKNPGLQKVILDELICAEEERDDLRVELKQSELNFHVADKQVGILREKLTSNRVNEVMSGVGLAVGGAVMGLAPFFWEKGIAYGVITVVVGLALIVGAAVGRISYK
jgi:VIT1/CCC1 family predicted Fe2+/Mn2+ transporter